MVAPAVITSMSSARRLRGLHLPREHGSSRAGFPPSSTSPTDRPDYSARTGYLGISRVVRFLVLITLVRAVSAMKTMTLSTTTERTLKRPSAKTTAFQIAPAASRTQAALMKTSELAPMPSLSHLENQVVRTENRQEYRRRLVDFIDWCFRLWVDWQNDKDLDQVLVIRLNEMFVKDNASDEGTEFLAAVRFMLPNLDRVGPNTLLRAVRAARVWSRLAPGRRRTPLPGTALLAVLGVVIAMQDKLTLQNRCVRTMGLYLLVTYKTYLRPGGCQVLLGCKLIPPTQAAGKTFGFLTILLQPTELGVPRETNLFDEALALDTDRLAGE